MTMVWPHTGDEDKAELQFGEGKAAIYVGGLPLGRGGTAVVWPCIFRIKSQGDYKDISAAVKCAHGWSDEEKDRLEAEIRLWERIPEHKNVAKLLAYRMDKGTHGGHGFMAYSVVECAKTDLDKLIFKDDDFAMKCTFDDILVLLIQVCKGLEHLHEQNIIHYDLKPRNVLMSEGGEAKISDFGRSRIIDQGQNSVSVSFPGTFGHMAPEVWALRFPRRVTKAVDVFSLGVLMFILVNRTYESPKEKKHPGQYIMCGSISGYERLWCAAPHELCKLVESCLQYKECEDEFSDHNRPTVTHVKKSLQQMRGKSWTQSRVPSYT